MLVSPLIQYLNAEFRPVVGLNHQRQPALAAEPLQNSGYAFAGQRDVDLDGEACPTPLVEHDKGSNRRPLNRLS